VESDFEFQMESLYMMASQPHVVAVGECGLDKVRYKSDLKIQKAAFEVQLQIAENLAKPVVIHCVRAQEEMLGIQRKLKPKTPLIVHGFNQKTAIGLQYLKQGFYLSLGAALLIEGSNAQQVLEKIPVEFLFLETDDTIISIKSVYKKAASLLNMDEIELEKQLESNFNTIFGK
jgi:TatD DNase family protein